MNNHISNPILRNHHDSITNARQFVKNLPRNEFIAVIAQFDLPRSTKKMMIHPKKTVTEMLQHNRICIDIIEANGGKVVKELGDAVLATFQSVPLACECALNVIHNFRKFGGGLCTKVTITAGRIEKVLTRCEDDVYGVPVNLCNRMATCAKNNSVIIEETRYDEVRYWLKENAEVKYCRPKVETLKDFGDVELRKITLNY